MSICTDNYLYSPIEFGTNIPQYSRFLFRTCNRDIGFTTSQTGREKTELKIGNDR